jgi:hypothetical protein
MLVLIFDILVPYLKILLIDSKFMIDYINPDLLNTIKSLYFSLYYNYVTHDFLWLNVYSDLFDNYLFADVLNSFTIEEIDEGFKLENSITENIGKINQELHNKRIKINAEMLEAQRLIDIQKINWI